MQLNWIRGEMKGMQMMHCIDANMLVCCLLCLLTFRRLLIQSLFQSVGTYATTHQLCDETEYFETCQ